MADYWQVALAQTISNRNGAIENNLRSIEISNPLRALFPLKPGCARHKPSTDNVAAC